MYWNANWAESELINYVARKEHYIRNEIKEVIRRTKKDEGF